jgi:hypothetical protein
MDQPRRGDPAAEWGADSSTLNYLWLAYPRAILGGAQVFVQKDVSQILALYISASKKEVQTGEKAVGQIRLILS